jgi:uncharacterized protein DUF222
MDSGEELRQLAAQIDALIAEFCRKAREFQRQGGHLADGCPSAVAWLRNNCKMSATSAADRLCVGKELESLPQIAQALAGGEVGYQSAAVLCHLREQLEDKRDLFDEEEMLAHARRFSVQELRLLCRYARHAADPDGFARDEEFNFARRRLHISPMADGMHVIDGVLDPVGGAAVKTALEALATSGPRDDRKHSQRMADALVELTHHALDSGKLPARRSVRPHVSLTTTMEALKGELGAPAVDVELSLPMSTKTLERFACDCTMSRVLLADSTVIDVGRATRVVSAPTGRALKVRDKGCRFPGCDRPANWTSPHHIVFWTRQGGHTNLPNLVSLCHYHHRLVHEGGWQVVKKGEEIRFVPPERTVFRKARGPGVRWAA